MNSPPGCARPVTPTTPRCTPRRPRVCNSAELLQQVEFTQKQIDMTKEALAAQDARTKAEIKATEDETAAKNAEVEAMLVEVGELNSQVERLTSEVHGKEAELVTLHTANQILAQHMREEIEELRDAAARERIAKEQLTPQINEINAAICSAPNRSFELERQQQELQAQVESFRNSPEDFMTFDERNQDLMNFSPLGRPQPRDLDFVSPSRPPRDTPTPLRDSPQGSQRSPNYYTNMLLNPRPPTPPQLPNYNVEQWAEPRRPRSAGLPPRNLQAAIQQRSRTPPPPSPPLPTFGQRATAGQWYDEDNACQLPSPPLPAVARNQENYPTPPPLPSYNPAQWYVSPNGGQQQQGDGAACSMPQSDSPPIRTAFNANQFSSPPIQVGTARNVYMPTPPPLPAYNPAQYYSSPLQEPIRRPLRPVQRPNVTPERVRSPSPVRPVTPPMQYPNYAVALSPGNQSQGPQFIPPTPPPLPNYTAQQYAAANAQPRLRRRQPLPGAAPVNLSGLDDGGANGGSCDIGDISIGSNFFPEVVGFGSPALMGMGTPPPRPPTPPSTPFGFVGRDVAGSDSPLVPPNGGGCCAPGGNRGGSPPPNARRNYNQAELNACPVGPNVDGYCPCTQMALGGRPATPTNQDASFPQLITPPGMGLRNVTADAIPFQDMSFSPNQRPLTPPSFVYNRQPGINEGSFDFDQANMSFSPIRGAGAGRPPAGIEQMTPPNFQDVSFAGQSAGGPQSANRSAGRSPARNAGGAWALEGIQDQDLNFSGGANMSFSPIQLGRQGPARRIDDMSPPSFQEMSFAGSNRSGPGPLAASTPLGGGAWALEGIQDQDLNFSGGANLSFSPIQVGRQGPARRLDDITPPSFQDMSFGSPGGGANQNAPACGPMASTPDRWGGIEGIQNESFDFNEGGANLSFSPIQVDGRGAGRRLDEISPPAFQDASFASGNSFRGLTPPPRANQNESGVWAMGGIQNESMSFGGGADLSFSPIRLNRQSPARRLDDVSPPASFRDVSLPSGIGSSPSPGRGFQYRGPLTLADRRGDFGIEDESFDFGQGADLSFGTPPRGRPTTPVSPFGAPQGQRTPPAGSPDLFQFSPQIQMTPPSPGSCALPNAPPQRTAPPPVDLRRQLPPNFNPTNLNLIHFSPNLSPEAGANQRQRSLSPPPSGRFAPRDLRYELMARPEAIYEFQNAGTPQADLTNRFMTPPQNRTVGQSPPNLMAFSPEAADFMEFSPVSDMMQFSPSPNRNSPGSCARTR